MTFLKRLQSHRGGLLRIKSQLYWYGGRGWDGTPDRICLVLDAAGATTWRVACTATIARPAPLGYTSNATDCDDAVALLLIDGAPHWVCVAQADVELL